MTRSIQGVTEWARENPKRDGGSWNGWCASFVYRAGGFSQSFGNAMAAGDWQESRGRLRRDWNNAPTGAIHYWAGVGGDGHTCFDLGGNVLLMASGSVTSSWGTAMGTVSFQTYANKQIPYRGWSMFWGEETLAGASSAGTDSTPIGGFLMALSDGQQDQMYNALVKHGPNGDYYTPDAIINIIRGEVTTALASIAAGGIMFPGAGYMAFPAIANTIREGDAPAEVNIDEGKLAASLAPLLAANIGGLSDADVERLAKATADEQAKRLAN